MAVGTGTRDGQRGREIAGRTRGHRHRIDREIGEMTPSSDGTVCPDGQVVLEGRWEEPTSTHTFQPTGEKRAVAVGRTGLGTIDVDHPLETSGGSIVIRGLAAGADLQGWKGAEILTVDESDAAMARSGRIASCNFFT